MAGRGNVGITDTINKLIAAMAQEHQDRVPPINDALRRLNLFEKWNPPCFKGGYNLEVAQTWLHELEKIFHALQCDEADKETFIAYALSEDAKNWWDGIRRRLEVEGTAIIWALFQEWFLKKYFPKDIQEKKEMEFLALTQGSMIVGEFLKNYLTTIPTTTMPYTTV